MIDLHVEHKKKKKIYMSIFGITLKTILDIIEICPIFI